MHLSSSGGVELAVHDFGGSGPPLLIAHATGFHAHAYAPLAHALADRFRVVGIDLRGHGEASRPVTWSGDAVDWRGFTDDVIVAAEATAPRGGIVGFGHSLGGAALLAAAARRPVLFDRLVLFEPIAYPPPAPAAPPVDPESLPLVVGARRRRRRFDSVAAALAHLGSKPPMAAFHPPALHGYVEHGFRPTDDGAVELCCTPEFEAATFAGAISNGVWDVLPQVTTPVVVITGAVEPDQPSWFAEDVVARLRDGRLRQLDDLDHFGPLTHPHRIADVISA